MFATFFWNLQACTVHLDDSLQANVEDKLQQYNTTMYDTIMNSEQCEQCEY